LYVEAPLLHHAVALTIAEIVRSLPSYRRPQQAVRLLTQDPAYRDEAKVMLRKIGFELAGEHGAGGFAEIDDESIVFAPSVGAPVKQMIADLARPVANYPCCDGSRCCV
jgi:hypothetical protein